MTDKNLKIGVFSVIMLAVLITISFILYDQVSQSAKSAPINPMADEELKQARTLQKQGELTNAFEIFEHYALRGYPDAMFQTAKSYSRGWGVKPDLEKARHFFRLAVEYNFSYRGQTAYELGRLFQRSQGPDCNNIAVGWFKKAMEWNFKKASLQLSKHYELGLGVGQDIGQAVYYYEIATRAGYESALLKYAYILLKGRYGVTPDSERAYAMVEQAVFSLKRKVRVGSSTAAKQLGRLYQKGQLVPVNLEESRIWFLQAARLGSRGGMHDLAHVMLANKKPPIYHDEALVWLRKAASLGHGGAMTALGRFHLKEVYGLKKSMAVQWFEKGVEAGHGGAMQELAKLYDKGILVSRDRPEAIRLAQMGSNMGHSGSEKLLKKLLKASEKSKRTSKSLTKS